MTTIKNKQTGETLTGEIRSDLTNYFFFKIKGTREEGGTQMRHDEWEILPPPLPTGIGAVVKDAQNSIYVRVYQNPKTPWKIIQPGENSSQFSDTEVSCWGPVTILSEGITL